MGGLAFSSGRRIRMKQALISVYHKEGIVEFAMALLELGGWEIWASGGTARHLTTSGVPVKDVAELVGGGAILGHRVVTLSRELHAGLLATHSDADIRELEQLGLPFIDLVCVDLYPLQEEIAKPEATRESVIDKTDIGGPTMLRSAAKGRRAVIADPADRDLVLKWLQSGEPHREVFLDSLAAKAEYIVAQYCLASARYTGDGVYEGFAGSLAYDLGYAENRWQKDGALYSAGTNDPLAVDRFRQAEGAAPGFINVTDLDRMLQTITHIAAAFDLNYEFVPRVAIGVKHGNACGAAIGWDSVRVLQGMLNGDQVAVHGAFVMTNFDIAKEEAETLRLWEMKQGKRLIDGVVVPALSDEAKDVLDRKEGKCRMFVNPALRKLTRDSLDQAPRFRYVRGGFLRQSNYTYVLNLRDERLVRTARLAEMDEMTLLLAWGVNATSNSNTITIARSGELIGNAVGQQDRWLAAELAVMRGRRGQHSFAGSLAVSDSFCPFPDAPLALADAGVMGLFTTSGSVHDDQVFNACAERKLIVYSLPDKVARGFFGH